MDEFALIRRFFTGLGPKVPEILLGPGDDCALLQMQAGEQLAISVDTSVEGRHFPAQADPWAIGWRCLGVALSDLAAMGARPLGFTLAITLPDADENWLTEFSRGLGALADQLACPLIGGDTTRGPLTLSVQVQGAVDRQHVWRRSGAQPGQIIAVLGSLGSAAAGLRSFHEQPERLHDRASWDSLEKAYMLPQPLIQEALGLSRGVSISSAIDISDGLLADLQHLLASSAVAAELDLEQLPLDPLLLKRLGKTLALDAALHGGDDYALLLTLDEADFPLARNLCPQLTRIGRLVKGAGIRTPEGDLLEPEGYNHFSGQQEGS
ncbi:thiamine-monophosphate kinase [Marinospirillum celere]|uniref:Thiamine-monophosphate kinase n=1 Tax=Marinospirillum celere TaxID=1122252 RepID=A0A1I1HDG1_9GAMM|nr:thiamine-phosphate kinase [Marinospirillum celere]SFC19523.1 thiamine-monophosphate kinase [Marinospirillum celere]